jgi:predicted GIY-YIG superfamily endonuclease
VSLDRHYIGFPKSPQKRLRQHRAEKVHWTARASDWSPVGSQEVATAKEALSLEKQIKVREAKRFLQQVIVPPKAE